AKSLPESIDLNSAVRKEWQLKGEVLLSELDRMPTELIHSTDVMISYEILFRHSKKGLGEAIIRIESMLELICQRSLDPFEFKLQTNNIIGFISKIEDEVELDADVSPSWVEGLQVDPKALLEDEILLIIPDIPVKPGAELDSQYLADHEDMPVDEEIKNPFAVLKNLK
ncbi:MAG: YceD family protein, partial [Marinicella sp.]